MPKYPPSCAFQLPAEYQLAAMRKSRLQEMIFRILRLPKMESLEFDAPEFLDTFTLALIRRWVETPGQKKKRKPKSKPKRTNPPKVLLIGGKGVDEEEYGSDEDPARSFTINSVKSLTIRRIATAESRKASCSRHNLTHINLRKYLEIFPNLSQIRFEIDWLEAADALWKPIPKSAASSGGSLWNDIITRKGLVALHYKLEGFLYPGFRALKQIMIGNEIKTLSEGSRETLEELVIDWHWDLDESNSKLLLTSFPNLKRLRIHLDMSELSPGTHQSFCDAFSSSNCTKLVHLEVKFQHLALYDHKLVAILRAISHRWPNLRSLELNFSFAPKNRRSWPKSSTLGIEEIIKIFQNVQMLRIDGLDMVSDGRENLFAEGSESGFLSSKIKNFILFDSSFLAPNHLVYFLKGFSSLEHLSIPGIDSSESPSFWINRLKTLSNDLKLQSLCLSGTHASFQDEKASFTFEALNKLTHLLPNLQRLRLDNLSPSDSMPHCANLRTFTRIRHLSLRPTTFSREFFDLSHFPQMPSIKRLDLSPLALSPESLTKLFTHSPRMLTLTIPDERYGPRSEIPRIINLHLLQNPDLIVIRIPIKT